MYRCPNCDSIFNTKHYYRASDRVYQPSAVTGGHGRWVNVKRDVTLSCEFCSKTFNPANNYKRSDSTKISVQYLEIPNAIDLKNIWSVETQVQLYKQIEFISTLSENDRMRYITQIIKTGYGETGIIKYTDNEYAYIDKSHFVYAKYKNIFPLQCSVNFIDAYGWILTPYYEELQSWTDELLLKARQFLDNTSIIPTSTEPIDILAL